MKFLIAGFGSIGRRHFRNLKSLGENDILFYRRGKSTLPDDELKGFIVENDLSVALDHGPDAVIISNPSALHLQVAMPAAQMGCHLLLEKPISNTLANLERFHSIVSRSGSRVLVGFQLRFHPGLKKVKDTLASGGLGKPLSARAFWGEYLPDWHPWEDYRKSYSARSDLGGGVVLTLSHPFDYLRWLLGEVSSVSGRTQRSGQLDLDVEDIADVDLEFGNDLRASVHLDYLEKPPAHNLEILCSGGQINWEGISGLVRTTGATGLEQRFPVPAGFERNDLFLAEMRHFIDIINGKAEPLCTLEDGKKALEIALAVNISSKERRNQVMTS